MNKRRSFIDLPQEIWGKILSIVNEQDVSHVSLVSKHFLSITNNVKATLKISDQTLPLLDNLLRRFQNLETVIITTDPPVNHVGLLQQISLSGLDHKPRTNLKRFQFQAPAHFSYKNLIALADLFPWIEEISFPPLVYSSKNFVIQDLLPKLKELKKLTFSRYCEFLSDEFLVCLSTNCKKLESIDIRRCEYIGEEAIGFLMKNSSNFTNLILPELRKSRDLNDPLAIKNVIINEKNLHTLRLHSGNVSEELIYNLAKAKPPLKNLEINFISNSYSKRENFVKADCFVILFQECSSVEHLYLNRYKHLSDSLVDRVSLHLTKLTSINLGDSSLTNASFFQLTNSCPLLQEIKMDRTNVGVGDFSEMSLQKNENMRFLSLLGNKRLGNRTLRQILFVCPNLQFLNLRYCLRITSKGVREIFMACNSLIHLNIDLLNNVSNIFGDNFEGRTICLKILEAEKTRLKDETLCQIGKICNELESLSIKLCTKVTNIGVMEVVRTCKKLEKINLSGCHKIRNNIIDEVTSLRPSVKIIPPKDI